VPCFFGELALGCRAGILSFLNFAFWQHPRAIVLALPEWAAGVSKKHFQAIPAAVKEYSGANFAFQSASWPTVVVPLRVCSS
jgi:hypothetical protein